MSRSWIKTITTYFEEVLYEDFSFRGFCSGYEKWWNFEFQTDWKIQESERKVLQKLFDYVVVYTDDNSDLKSVPLYKSEQEIRKVIKDAYKSLKE